MLIFSSFVTYFSIHSLSSASSYLAEIKMERLRSEAYQISELLINDPGEPLNWDVINFANVRRIGLLDHTQNKTNLLSKAKLDRLIFLCSTDYNSLKRKFGTDLNFQIFFKLEGSTAVCSSPSLPEKNKGSITRVFAYLEGAEVKYGEMMLNVW